MPKPAVSIVAGLVIGTLAWIDPLFIPLVLTGPPISGAVVATREVALRWVLLAWASGGATMLVTDAVINQEDVGFHAVLTVVMVALAALGYAPVRAIRSHGRRALVR